MHEFADVNGEDWDAMLSRVDNLNALEKEQQSLVKAATQITSFALQYDLLPNPDPVLRQFGGAERIGLYTRMFRQVGFLAGTCKCWIDTTMALPFTIVAGDPNDGRSRLMRDTIADAYERIDKRSTFDRKALRGRFFGFSPGLQFWSRVDFGLSTGIIAPLRVMDLEPEDIEFRASDNAPILRTQELVTFYGGKEILQENFISLVWGSTRTRYGMGEFLEFYNDVWKYDLLQKMVLEQLETIGRPILHFIYPSAWTRDTLLLNLNNLKVAGWKVVVPISSEVATPQYSFPNTNALVTGSTDGFLGQMRRLEASVNLNIIGADFDKGGEGGNRAKMSSQIGELFKKATAGADALDEMWNNHWFKPVAAVNYPGDDPALWPRRVTDSLETEDVGTRLAVFKGAKEIGWELSRKQFGDEFGLVWAENDDLLNAPVTPMDKVLAATIPPAVDADGNPVKPPQKDGGVVVFSETGEEIDMISEDELRAVIASRNEKS